MGWGEQSRSGERGRREGGEGRGGLIGVNFWGDIVLGGVITAGDDGLGELSLSCRAPSGSLHRPFADPHSRHELRLASARERQASEMRECS